MAKLEMWSGLTKRGYMLSKNGPFFGPHTLRMKSVYKNILTLYIFGKLMVLTLERVKTDFNLTSLYTMVVHMKKWCFGSHVAPLHK